MRQSSVAFPVSLAVLSAVSVARGQVYVEGVNEENPIDDGWTATGGHEQAFRWTAQNTFDLTQLEFHCSAITTMIIRLREDTGGTPGAILREVTFNAPSLGWIGGTDGSPGDRSQTRRCHSTERLCGMPTPGLPNRDP